jgi:hypothetical protein
MRKGILLLATTILLSGLISCSVKVQVTPVLLLATDNDFGTYTTEILKLKDLMSLQLTPLPAKT